MSAFNVLTLGRFYDPEGFEFSLNIFEEFLNELTGKHHKKIKIQYVEDVDLIKSSVQEVRKLNCSNCLEVLNIENQAKIIEAYSQASILFLPTKAAKESIIVEALEHGVPILTYKLDDYGSLLHVAYSLTVQPGIKTQELSAFKALLKILYFDPEARRIMRKRAHEKGRSIQKGNLFSSGSN